MAQVYARDVPLLRTPEHADVLQVLWCPFDHPAQPRTAVFWRTAAAVDHVLAAPPEPPALQYDGYLLHPCHLTPEDVTEYPDSIELEPELRQRVENCRAWETVIAEVNGTEEVTSEEFYSEALSVAPGWKVGGWTSWNLTDPQPRSCDRCGSEMTPLLTIASAEWDDNRTTWIPEEEQIPDPGSYIEPDLAQPTMVRIAGGHNLQFYVCSESPDHPYIELAQ
ncbi:non-ribosomal peptide synthetase [Streptomyces sp. NPDC051546]|uniref:non-ribosomal peptide synthetase n=1 Tax=Streptomyces sp. NPDC051546 TaxID=3365655 RepID=UPI0037A34621